MAKKIKAASSVDGTKFGKLSHVDLSAEEMCLALRTATHPNLVDPRNNVAKKVDGGVFLQLNREGEESTVHLYVELPETFSVKTFEPQTDDE